MPSAARFRLERADCEKTTASVQDYWAIKLQKFSKYGWVMLGLFTFRSRRKEELEKLLSEDEDLLKMLVEQTVQQLLEAEMEEALQAGKGERTGERLGFRSGYYNRTLITRVGTII